MNDDFHGSMLLRTSNFSVRYKTWHGLLTAVSNVNFALRPNEIHALIGESGCGKTTLGLSISRLLPEDQVVYSGSVLYKGVEISSLRETDMEQYRGTEIATIFQEPMTSLNPVYTVERQIAEALQVRIKRKGLTSKNDFRKTSELSKSNSNAESLSAGQTHDYVLSLLDEVRIADPKRVASMHPHELSGGMRQRVMIAMALAEQPSCLIADEPTTALDATTQAQILILLKSLTMEYRMGTMLITHDLGVVTAVADFASIMYAGEIVEEAPTEELFRNPLHPYTVALIDSFPKKSKAEYRVKTVPGIVPSIESYPKGCRFHPRCSKAFSRCISEEPKLIEITPRHRVSCFLYGN